MILFVLLMFQTRCRDFLRSKPLTQMRSLFSFEKHWNLSIGFRYGHHLDSFQTFYVLSVSRNLISLSRLNSVGYSFTFANRCFSLFKHNNIIGFEILSEGLYKLKLDNIFESLLKLHHNVSTKCGLVNESLAYLQHKRLGHISKARIKRLVKNEILPDLNFIDLDICVDFIKGNKQKT